VTPTPPPSTPKRPRRSSLDGRRQEEHQGGEGPQERPHGTIEAMRTRRRRAGRPSPPPVLCPGQLTFKPMSTDTPLRDASPPDRHGYRCAVAVCLRLIVTAVEGLFRNPAVGSPARLCSPARRQAAFRRRRAGTAGSTPLQLTGGRRRKLSHPQLSTKELLSGDGSGRTSGPPGEPSHMGAAVGEPVEILVVSHKGGFSMCLVPWLTMAAWPDGVSSCHTKPWLALARRLMRPIAATNSRRELSSIAGARGQC